MCLPYIEIATALSAFYSINIYLVLILISFCSFKKFKFYCRHSDNQKKTMTQLTQLMLLFFQMYFDVEWCRRFCFC